MAARRPASPRSGGAATRIGPPTPRRRAGRRGSIPPGVVKSLVGVVLALLAVFMLVGLTLRGQGAVTDWMVHVVAPWLGRPRWILPFLFMILAYYLGRARGEGWDWELTLLGAAVAYVGVLGLAGLVDSDTAGKIGAGIASSLTPLFTRPGTAILMIGLVMAGTLLALDMSLPAVVEPAARLVGRALVSLFRPAPAQAPAAAAPTVTTDRAGREPAAGSGVRFGDDRVPPMPVAIQSSGPVSQTFAPAVPSASVIRDGGSIRDGGPIRGAGGVPGTAGAGAAAGAGFPGSTGLPRREYRLPPLGRLEDAAQGNGDSAMDHARNADIIERKLESFSIPARVVAWNAGPVVTQYEVEPSPDIKVSRIEALSDDLAMALAAPTIRIEAPIPGKSVVGLEIPNRHPINVPLRGILEEVDFRAVSKLTFALGRDVGGHPYAADLAKMPHMLIAGATGSGKSVMVNALITSLLCNATPDEVRLVLIDLKRVELSAYNGLPHLMVPVITEPERAKAALKWAVAEMENRYRRFAGANARNVGGYNETRADPADRLPYIVIIVDELADLMMREGKNVEDPIVRLAQKARATGIHMVLATQRPSVNVVTGLIKANFPSRIAFAMASQIDSRTILDMPGAEDLIGRGDMLFQPADLPKPKRLQGVFVSDKEIGEICAHWRGEAEPHYDMAIVETSEEAEGGEAPVDDDADRLLLDAVSVIQEYDRASASLLQRRLRVGYARAARIIDQLEARGYIGPFDGSNARQVLRRDPTPPRGGYGSGEDEV